MPDNIGQITAATSEICKSSEMPTAKILVLFGTRPEAIKLAPVITELKKYGRFQTVVVSSSQHTDLLAPFLKIFDIKTDYDLRVMTDNQTPNAVCARVLSSLDAILEREKPDIILVQGDTTTALAGALAAFNRRVKVGHVEAGLRSGNIDSPFPEELNRRLISQVAMFHFCATNENRKNLLTENVADEQIFVTGNTVVDALHFILKNSCPSAPIKDLIEKTDGYKRILLTTHRRESFGGAMCENLETLRSFVESHTDVCLFFPVHPNPNVRAATDKILADGKRIFLLESLDYSDFITMLKNAWLIVSDSGGVQEEAPSLGKPLLVLRENTERPEAIWAGVAKLVGENSLKDLLETNYNNEDWINSVKKIENPFGRGDSAKRIVEILEGEFSAKAQKCKGKTEG
ncbi:MAG: UDP-N-acetylglucosamine 2-epimerase (non-hydrolyzing) [Acidobacteriota bacterium]|nr:UDP-N-acetylglucosamine 2-epimerase (non-hydrolyzing) [Acidobacteriota bacterium]